MSEPEFQPHAPAVPAAIRELAGQVEADLHLVGGCLRDSLLGRETLDIDIAVDADVAPIAVAIDPEAVVHERFGTAALKLGDLRVDLARTRSETYPEPGALPVVEPAGIEADLARRDFTINAMALRIGADPSADVLLDPQGGLADINSSTLRLLHPGSIRDDPTRSLRAARYAARLRFAPTAATLDQIGETDLTTVSADRVRAELMHIASEPEPGLALRLLADWGLLEAGVPEIELISSAIALLRDPVWAGRSTAEALVDAAIATAPLASRLGRGGLASRIADLVALDDPKPSSGASAGDGLEGAELVLARAAGAGWLDRYVSDWASLKIEIDGEDLIRSGVEAGPAIGAGLAAARAAALDGDAPDQATQLEVALAAARSVAG